GSSRVSRRGDHEALDAEGARLGEGHPETSGLERAGGVLSLVLGPEVAEAQVLREPGQREQRGPTLAEGNGLLARGERRELAKAVHAGRAAEEIVLGERARDLGQIVPDGQHLAAAFADGEETAGFVPPAANSALDMR